jgi:hypothetical protein
VPVNQAQLQFGTYVYLREDGTPYYVGKFSYRGRVFAKRRHRVPVPKDLSLIIIQEFPCEADAFAAEIFLIRYYGRKDNGTGILRNRTNGGEGSSNPSKETRAKLRAASLGHSVSTETRIKIGAGNKIALTGRRIPKATRVRMGITQKVRRAREKYGA